MSENAIRFTFPPRRCETCGRPAAYRARNGRRRWHRGITLCERHVRELRGAVRRARPRRVAPPAWSVREDGRVTRTPTFQGR